MDSLFFATYIFIGLLFFFFFKLSKGTTFQYPELSLCWFFFPAEQVTNNLKELAQQVTPGDIVSMYGVRKAMGISIPSPVVENTFVDLTEGTCPVSPGEWRANKCE